ncbi:hypothetical protein MTO96_014182 [Rhipicephalus appendiculatus]
MNGGAGLYEESRSSLEAPQPLHIPAKRLAYGQADCAADPMAAGGVIRQSPWASPWPGAEAAFEAPHHYQQGVRDSASYFYPAAADRKPFNLWPAAAKGYELGPTAAADACQAYSQAWCPCARGGRRDAARHEVQASRGEHAVIYKTHTHASTGEVFGARLLGAQPGRLRPRLAKQKGPRRRSRDCVGVSIRAGGVVVEILRRFLRPKLGSVYGRRFFFLVDGCRRGSVGDLR